MERAPVAAPAISAHYASLTSQALSRAGESNPALLLGKADALADVLARRGGSWRARIAGLLGFGEPLYHLS
jgi:hypothetical protein